MKCVELNQQEQSRKQIKIVSTFKPNRFEGKVRYVQKKM